MQICLQIPWANLGKSAVVVEIDRLYILAGPRIETSSESDEAYMVLLLPACMPACGTFAACMLYHGTSGEADRQGCRLLTRDALDQSCAGGGPGARSQAAARGQCRAGVPACAPANAVWFFPGCTADCTSDQPYGFWDVRERGNSDKAGVVTGTSWQSWALRLARAPAMPIARAVLDGGVMCYFHVAAGQGRRCWQGRRRRHVPRPHRHHHRQPAAVGRQRAHPL